MKTVFTILWAISSVLMLAQETPKVDKRINKIIGDINSPKAYQTQEEAKFYQNKNNKIKTSLKAASFAQEDSNTFVLLENQPGDYWYSSMDWGDYDQDGDMDLLISGAHPREGEPYDAGASTTHVYDNDGNGNLTLNNKIALQGVHASDVKWLDFDNDGDLDIAMIGIDYDTAFNMSAIYQNDNGTFLPIEVGTNGVSWGGISSGDYDNDGDIDILMAGWNVDDEKNNYASTFLWENNNGTLERTNISTEVPGVFNGNIAWVDIDKDMDLDIIVSPAYGAEEPTLRVYTRENEAYSLSQEIKNANSYAMFALGDYNNDGYVDIAVQTTDENYDSYVEILKNNSGNFEYVNSLPSVSSNGAVTPLSFGDYDNDGDLDLVIAGLNSDYEGVSLLYNNTSGDFSLVENTGFDAVGGHSLSWVDIDNDLDLDILITGFIDDTAIGEFYGTSRLYRNEISAVNTAPSAPTELSAQWENGNVIFNWSGALDEQTPTDGLKYLLTVGTSSGDIDVAHYEVTGTSWMLKNLSSDNTYYWCVKAIDTSHVKSECSVEQTISSLSTTDIGQLKSEIELVTNPIEDGILRLSTTSWKHEDIQISLLDMQGRKVLYKSYKNVRNSIEIPVYYLSSGKYFLQYSNAQDKGVLPVIIK